MLPLKGLLYSTRRFRQTTRLLSSNSIQSTSLPTKRICIVGAGPAGFYAAQYILKTLEDCVVDIIEKLPIPFGLVRFGVAPDHPEVKNVINTFTKTAEHKNLRYFGNISLGNDISLAELRNNYHAVLLTYGADRDRQLDIPNEEQRNVLSARQFVAWYNGLPGAENLKPNLNAETVTIVGQGNVAIDVARMLLSPVDLLRQTDTTDYALEHLSQSKVKRIYLVGRRGPLQAAFTIKELREMLKLPNVQTVWRPQDFEDVATHLPNLQRPRKRLTELMLKSLSESSPLMKQSGKQFLPVFQRAPKVIDMDQIEFNITKLENDRAVLTHMTERLPAELVLRSIGYKSICVDTGICFDDRNGRVLNEYGRVLKNTDDKTIDRGLYVAGWLGTGPTGVILTTMSNAFGVAKAICDDISLNQINTSMNKPGLTINDYSRVVTWAGWKRIDKAETEAGKLKGKPREKITNIETMLNIAGV